MRTITRLLFISMLFSTAIPSMLFSSERESSKKNPSDLSSPKMIESLQELLLEDFATPLGKAVLSSDLNNTKQLLRQKADISDSNFVTVAALQSDSAMVKLLLEHKAGINHGNPHPAKIAFAQSNVAMLSLLLEHNADIHNQVPEPLNQELVKS